MFRRALASIAALSALLGPAAGVVHHVAPASTSTPADDDQAASVGGVVNGLIKSLPQLFSVTKSSFSPDATRWDPCTTVHWRINLAGAPANALSDATGAIRRISRATGLRFAYDGTTSVVPDGDYGKSGDAAQRWPDLTIAFVDAGSTQNLPTGAAGVGGWHAVSVSADNGSTWVPRIVTGFVQIDRDKARELKAGFGTGGTLGGLFMHELGHAVGLGHVGDPSDMMYPTITAKRAQWGRGDLAGLRAVGALGGCLPGFPPPGGYWTYSH